MLEGTEPMNAITTEKSGIVTACTQQRRAGKGSQAVRWSAGITQDPPMQGRMHLSAFVERAARALAYTIAY